jgi:hypothetical protein
MAVAHWVGSSSTDRRSIHHHAEGMVGSITTSDIQSDIGGAANRHRSRASATADSVGSFMVVLF